MDPQRTAPLQSHARSSEEDLERMLRPKSLDDFIGQQKIKDNLRIFITAARQRGETLDHVLVSGPPRLGKPTLAYIIADERSAGIKTTSGPVLDKPAGIAGILTNIHDGDVVFIGEIRRLSHV